MTRCELGFYVGCAVAAVVFAPLGLGLLVVFAVLADKQKEKNKL